MSADPKALWALALNLEKTSDSEANKAIIAWLRLQRAAERGGAPTLAYPRENTAGNAKKPDLKTTLGTMIDIAKATGFLKEDE